MLGNKTKLAYIKFQNNFTNNTTPFMAYFKQDLQLQKDIAIGQLTMEQLNTAHFDFTTAQIVINCTLKYALPPLFHKF